MKKALLSLLLTIAIMPMAFGQRPANAAFFTTDTVACGSFTWEANDSVYTASTVDTYTVGDSVYVLNLRLEAPGIDTATATPVTGNCFATWNNKRWTSEGEFIDTIRAHAAGQCDSVVKISVTLSGVETIDAETASECGFYVASWGDTIRTSLSATDTTIATASCSTMVHSLDITIIPNVVVPTESVVAEGCSYSWNGTLITRADSVCYDTVALANGCDSITSLVVTSFSNRTYDTTTVAACDRYILGTDTILADTLITTVDSSSACHVYSTLNVVIRHAFRDTASTVVRDTVGGCSLSWLGQTYFLADTMKAIYRYGTTTLGNCDSLMAIRITAFNGIQHDTTETEHCGVYTWNGLTIRNSGEYTYTDTTAATGDVPQCATVHHLLFSSVSRHDEQTQTRCAEYAYIFNSRQGTGRDTATFTASGIYETDLNGDTLYSKDRTSECITYHTLNLTIIPVQQKGTHLVDTTACDQFDFRFYGSHVFSRDIDTTFTLSPRTVNNCFDTAGHIILTIKRRTYANFDTMACNSYTWEGFTDKTYTRSTTDSVTLTGLKNTVGCDSVGLLNLTINPTPEVVIDGNWNLAPGSDGRGTATLQAICEDTTVTFAWYVGSETSPASTEASFERTVSDNTDVRLETTSADGCTATNWITITLNVGIDEAEVALVSIYPNPATRYLNIDCNEGLAEIAVFNALGQQVIARQASGTHTTLDLGHLANGAYSMRISTSDGNQVNRKFIINK